MRRLLAPHPPLSPPVPPLDKRLSSLDHPIHLDRRGCTFVSRALFREMTRQSATVMGTLIPPWKKDSTIPALNAHANEFIRILPNASRVVPYKTVRDVKSVLSRESHGRWRPTSEESHSTLYKTEPIYRAGGSTARILIRAKRGSRARETPGLL